MHEIQSTVHENQKLLPKVGNPLPFSKCFRALFEVGNVVLNLIVEIVFSFLNFRYIYQSTLQLEKSFESEAVEFW